MLCNKHHRPGQTRKEFELLSTLDLVWHCMAWIWYDRMLVQWGAKPSFNNPYFFISDRRYCKLPFKAAIQGRRNLKEGPPHKRKTNWKATVNQKSKHYISHHNNTYLASTVGLHRSQCWADYPCLVISNPRERRLNVNIISINCVTNRDNKYTTVSSLKPTILFSNLMNQKGIARRLWL